MSINILSGTGNATSTVNASTLSVTIAKPANVADGDLLLAFVMNNAGTGTFTPASGWTAIVTATSRRGGVYYKPIPSAAAETATGYAFANTVAGRMVGAIARVTGVNLSAPVGVGSGAAETAGTSGVVTLPSVSPAGAADLLLAAVDSNPGSSNADATYTFPAGFTEAPGLHASVGNTAGTVNAIGYKQLTAAGATGTTAVSGIGVPNGGNATPLGWQFTLSPAATTTRHGAATGSQSWAGAAVGHAPAVGAKHGSANGTTAWTSTAAGHRRTAGAAVSTPTVPQWLATPNAAAHRGGSASWVEETADAYAHAAAWNTSMALEMSVWRCATGEHVLSHDRSTARMFGTDLDIPATSWATLQTLRTTVGGFPMALLTDMLDHYAAKRIIVVDNKADTNAAAFLDLLDSYGGPARFILKGIYGQTATQIAGRARGYRGWGYCYETDGLSTISSWIGTWDIVGLNYGASQSAWNTFVAACQAAGKPYWPHILNTAASKGTADSKAAAAGGANAGYMISDVVDLVPTKTTSDGAQFTWTSTAAGHRPALAAKHGSASGTAAWTSTATGHTVKHGTATGSTTWAGTAHGHRTPRGTAPGTTAWTSTAAGHRRPRATATGTTTWTSLAQGHTPVIGGKSGHTAGTTTWTSTARGHRAPRGTATGRTTWTATATGHAPALTVPTGTAAGTYAWTSTASGHAPALEHRSGVAVGTVHWTGLAHGRGHPPRDLTLTYEIGRDRWTATAGHERWAAHVGGDRWTSTTRSEP